VVVIGPSRFNKLLKDAKDEGKNLNDLLAWAHARAIEKVYEKLPQGIARIKVVVDEFDRLRTEERLRRVLNLERIVLEQRPGAEEEMAVAAASILARAEWERWVEQESGKRGLDLRKMTRREARARKDAGSFAKISYLRQGAEEDSPSPSA
jgi:ribonuclease HIII